MNFYGAQTHFQTYTSNVTQFPNPTKVSNLPYDSEFGELTDDDDVPLHDGQGGTSPHPLELP